MADVSKNLEEKEIYFTKRITKFGTDTLLVAIPKDEKDFEHKDLVKVTLIRKADKNDKNDKEDGESDEKQNKKESTE